MELLDNIEVVCVVYALQKRQQLKLFKKKMISGASFE